MESRQSSTRSAVVSAGIGVAALLTAAATALPAMADSPHDNGHGQGQAHSNGHGNANGHDHGQANGHGQSDGQAASGEAGRGNTDHATTTGHNPPGNNGTVKIHDVYGDTAHHNVPHVDCDFAVAFWGFDAGQTLSVSFTGQAPTGAGQPLTVTGAPTSITSADDAGGGNDYDGELDFRADQLNLSSLGAPHPKQGYHVRLTVDTGSGVPGGAKTKVFWITPCASSAPSSPTGTSVAPTGTSTGTSTENGATSDTGAQPSAGETEASTAGQQTGGATLGMAATRPNAGIPTEVLGTKFTRSPNSTVAPAASSLPFTGAEITGMALTAAALIGGGVLFLVAGRRRRRLSSSS